MTTFQRCRFSTLANIEYFLSAEEKHLDNIFSWLFLTKSEQEWMLLRRISVRDLNTSYQVFIEFQGIEDSHKETPTVDRGFTASDCEANFGKGGNSVRFDILRSALVLVLM